MPSFQRGSASLSNILGGSHAQKSRLTPGAVPPCCSTPAASPLLEICPISPRTHNNHSTRKLTIKAPLSPQPSSQCPVTLSPPGGPPRLSSPPTTGHLLSSNPRPSSSVDPMPKAPRLSPHPSVYTQGPAYSLKHQQYTNDPQPLLEPNPEFLRRPTHLHSMTDHRDNKQSKPS